MMLMPVFLSVIVNIVDIRQWTEIRRERHHEGRLLLPSKYG
jgi:hypothetical protein